MSKRKANASIPVVDASSPDAPWTFFWPSQCFSDIIHYFDQENIDNSNSADVMPILNAMRPLLVSFSTSFFFLANSAFPSQAEFHKKFTNWPADVAAYVAAISIASRQLIRLHLGKPSFPDYQDLFWNYPKDLEKLLVRPLLLFLFTVSETNRAPSFRQLPRLLYPTRTSYCRASS